MRLLAVFLILLFFSSCSSEEDNSPEPGNNSKVFPENPRGITRAIEKSHPTWENIEGEMPEPKGSLSLFSGLDGQRISINAGEPIRIDLSSLEGIGDRLFLNVWRADSYFNISLEEGQAISVGTPLILEVETSTGYQPGKFCLFVAFGDENDQVSNHINVCVEILDPSDTIDDGGINDNENFIFIDDILLSDFTAEEINAVDLGQGRYKVEVRRGGFETVIHLNGDLIDGNQKWYIVSPSFTSLPGSQESSIRIELVLFGDLIIYGDNNSGYNGR